MRGWTLPPGTSALSTSMVSGSILRQRLVEVDVENPAVVLQRGAGDGDLRGGVAAASVIADAGDVGRERDQVAEHRGVGDRDRPVEQQRDSAPFAVEVQILRGTGNRQGSGPRAPLL